jgi:hypothetical protein
MRKKTKIRTMVMGTRSGLWGSIAHAIHHLLPPLFPLELIDVFTDAERGV